MVSRPPRTWLPEPAQMEVAAASLRSARIDIDATMRDHRPQGARRAMPGRSTHHNECPAYNHKPRPDLAVTLSTGLPAQWRAPCISESCLCLPGPPPPHPTCQGRPGNTLKLRHFMNLFNCNNRSSKHMAHDGGIKWARLPALAHIHDADCVVLMSCSARLTVTTFNHIQNTMGDLLTTSRRRHIRSPIPSSGNVSKPAKPNSKPTLAPQLNGRQHLTPHTVIPSQRSGMNAILRGGTGIDVTPMGGDTGLS